MGLKTPKLCRKAVCKHMREPFKHLQIAKILRLICIFIDLISGSIIGFSAAGEVYLTAAVVKHFFSVFCDDR